MAPDGLLGGCNIREWDGASGIKHNYRMFLAGMFLDDSYPSDSAAPVALDFTGAADFAELRPGLKQLFFIGDGLTGEGSGEVQRFVPPAGATRLYIGFADAASFSGNPGWYNDNTGSFSGYMTTEQGGCELLADVSGHPSSISRGQTLRFTAYASNRCDEGLTFDGADLRITGPANLVKPLYSGGSIEVAPGAQLSAPVALPVPSGAPLGTYNVALEVSRDGVVVATDAFDVDVQ